MSDTDTATRTANVKTDRGVVHATRTRHDGEGEEITVTICTARPASGEPTDDAPTCKRCVERTKGAPAPAVKPVKPEVIADPRFAWTVLTGQPDDGGALELAVGVILDPDADDPTLDASGTLATTDGRAWTLSLPALDLHAEFTTTTLYMAKRYVRRAVRQLGQPPGWR